MYLSQIARSEPIISDIRPDSLFKATFVRAENTLKFILEPHFVQTSVRIYFEMGFAPNSVSFCMASTSSMQDSSSEDEKKVYRWRHTDFAYLHSFYIRTSNF